VTKQKLSHLEEYNPKEHYLVSSGTDLEKNVEWFLIDLLPHERIRAGAGNDCRYHWKI
jgi:hypothetical protein